MTPQPRTEKSATKGKGKSLEEVFKQFKTPKPTRYRIENQKATVILDENFKPMGAIIGLNFFFATKQEQ